MPHLQLMGDGRWIMWFPLGTHDEPVIGLKTGDVPECNLDDSDCERGAESRSQGSKDQQ
jgi:hypothetical protein